MKSKKQSFYAKQKPKIIKIFNESSRIICEILSGKSPLKKLLKKPYFKEIKFDENSLKGEAYNLLGKKGGDIFSRWWANTGLELKKLIKKSEPIGESYIPLLPSSYPEDLEMRIFDGIDELYLELKRGDIKDDLCEQFLSCLDDIIRSRPTLGATFLGKKYLLAFGFEKQGGTLAERVALSEGIHMGHYLAEGSPKHHNLELLEETIFYVVEPKFRERMQNSSSGTPQKGHEIARTFLKVIVGCELVKKDPKNAIYFGLILAKKDMEVKEGAKYLRMMIWNAAVNEDPKYVKKELIKTLNLDEEKIDKLIDRLLSLIK